MKKVLHILSAIDGGGGERVVYNYYEHIDRDKVHFDVTAIDTGRKQLLEDGFRKLGGGVIYVPKKIIPRLRVINKILKEGNYDAIHCHRIFLAEVYLLLGFINHVHIRIAHAHMAYVVGHKKGRFLNWLFKPLLKFLTTDRLACGKAAGIYVWGSLKNVTILNNAIDLNKFSYSPDIRYKYRKKLGVFDDEILIGHVGRFNSQKNHVFLLKVFDELCNLYSTRSFHLVMIGDGELKSSIEERTYKLDNKDKIHFLGLQQDVYNWMQAFDLFLLPSLFEGLPVVGVEAQAAGLPCVFSTSITSEFKMGENVEFISLDTPLAEWAKAVYELSESQTRENNRKLISQRGYNIEIECKKLEKIYCRE